MEKEVSPNNYHFAGWATRSNILCTDGRTIMPDAFSHQDGEIVPLVWNHDDRSVNNILGKALLHSINGDMYAYCLFNDTESGSTAHEVVKHGDIVALSIRAGQLKHTANKGVTHGRISEVSLVLAGANRGAFIDSVIAHGEASEEEATIYRYVPGEDPLVIYHSDEAEEAEEDEGEEEIEEVETEAEVEEETDAVDETEEVETETEEEPGEDVEHADIKHADNSAEEPAKEESDEESKEDGSEENTQTLGEVIEEMPEKYKKAMYAVVGQIVEEYENEKPKESENIKHSEGGDETMKTNVFDQAETKTNSVLTHADQEAIISLAKTSGVGSLKAAMEMYVEDHKETLAHGFDTEGEHAISLLFPDYKDVHPGAPELLERDQSWVASVMRKAHKSPISRVRTRQADARANELRAKGYNDREVAKSLSGNLKLLMRTTDPQTVYRRDELHRDDIIDITDFDVVAYQKVIMKHNLEEDIALAALIGDGREDTDPDKIHENHIRSIWNDEELYTIHYDVDIAAAKAELQGSNTSANFGENYIRAEAMVTASLYSREKYKGKGQLDLYIEPHELNVMLLARDLNGRRIYDSKADLAKALNVNEIHEVEQFAGKTRTTKDGKTKKLLGIFVNMANYQFGSTKGGEIANFEDFDIDFNKYKYLMETRLSGALTEVYSAIALEEDVTEAAG